MQSERSDFHQGPIECFFHFCKENLFKIIAGILVVGGLLWFLSFLISPLFIGEREIKVSNQEYLNAINAAMQEQGMLFEEVGADFNFEGAVVYIDADGRKTAPITSVYFEDVSLLNGFSPAFYCADSNIVITLKTPFIFNDDFLIDLFYKDSYSQEDKHCVLFAQNMPRYIAVIDILLEQGFSYRDIVRDSVETCEKIANPKQKFSRHEKEMADVLSAHKDDVQDYLNIIQSVYDYEDMFDTSLYEDHVLTLYLNMRDPNSPFWEINQDTSLDEMREIYYRALRNTQSISYTYDQQAYNLELTDILNADAQKESTTKVIVAYQFPDFGNSQGAKQDVIQDRIDAIEYVLGYINTN
ncbi:MAG: hypothetical protein LBS36_08010 [Oscillospiraceae bacterium]|jgi:hypothetical protein|nr:hypothetical protein [Oscillospiraceae bacterium]